MILGSRFFILISILIYTKELWNIIRDYNFYIMASGLVLVAVFLLIRL